MKKCQTAQVYKQIASEVWRKPVILFISSWRTIYKLVLTNMLKDLFLNIEVLHKGSVTTRLRCDGIFNDKFIT